MISGPFKELSSNWILLPDKTKKSSLILNNQNYKYRSPVQWLQSILT